MSNLVPDYSEMAPWGVAGLDLDLQVRVEFLIKAHHREILMVHKLFMQDMGGGGKAFSVGTSVHANWNSIVSQATPPLGQLSPHSYASLMM